MASAPAPQFRFRPLPIADLLDETFRLYRRHFQVLAGVAVLLALPGLLTALLSGSYRVNTVEAFLNLMQNGASQSGFQRFQEQQAQVNPGWSSLGFLLGLALIPFFSGAIIRAVLDAAIGRPVTIGSVLRGTLASYWAIQGLVWLLVLVVFGAAIVAVILLALLLPVGVLLMLAFFPLALWLAIRLTVAIPALLAERIGPIKAIRRSWNLVGGSWWRTFGILLLTSVLSYIVFALLGFMLAGVAALLPGLSSDLRAALVLAATQLAGALVTPILSVVVTLIYFDLRVRKEGFDLEQLARQTGSSPAPA